MRCFRLRRRKADKRIIDNVSRVSYRHQADMWVCMCVCVRVSGWVCMSLCVGVCVALEMSVRVGHPIIRKTKTTGEK